MSAEDYPFRPNEPWTNVRQVHGLERLCYISDRGLAQTLFELYQALSRDEKTRDAVKRAHSGMLGPDAERMAIQAFGKTLGHPARDKMEDFLWRLSSVKQSRAGVPAQRGDDLRKEVG